MKNGHKDFNNSPNYHDENHDETEFYQENKKGAPDDTQLQNNAHLQNSPIDCDGVQLINAQCHMVSISISWYTECWTIQLKCTLQTKYGITTVWYPTHQHGQTNFWYVCLLEKLFSIT